MKPLHVNLLALICAIAIVTLVYVTLGRGPWLQTATLLFTVPWTIQLVLLAIAANGRRAPPPYVSKLTFAMWVAAAYPFIYLMFPLSMFPHWFIAISAPIGFLLCYPLISVFLWILSLLPRWRLPRRWTE